MVFFRALIEAAGLFANPIALAALIVGMLLGMIVGIVPGLGAIVVLSLLIPITLSWDPAIAFIFLTAVIGGGNFAGSITAILLNTPGTAPNAATLLDGHPMAKQGRAGEAIGAAATASALGAIVGVCILIVSVPVMQQIVVLFGAREIFLLALWGVVIVATINQGDTIAGLISGSIGFVLGMHGFNIITATPRWTYDSVHLRDGIPLLPLIVGLFAITEAIKLIAEGRQISDTGPPGERLAGKWAGVKKVLARPRLLLSSSAVGTVIGLIPGVGSMVATFFAYSRASLAAKNTGSFGQGDIRGVIAPEAANDAKDGGGFIPTLALGIPGSAVLAIIFGAFVLHGISPGPLLIQNHIDIVAVIILSLLFSNVLSSIVGLAIAGQLAYITRINVYLLTPVVFIASFYAVYLSSNVYFNVFLTLVFGVVGYLMMKINMSRIPLLIAFVLAPVLEQNFYRGIQFADGSFIDFFETPMAIILGILLVVSLLWPVFTSIKVSDNE